MARLLIVLLTALVFEAVGVVLLSRGLKQIGEPQNRSVTEMLRVARRGVSNPSILSGVALEAIFFCALIYLLSQADVSLIWPLTSLGFVITTLAAWLFGNEKVSLLRWVGVILIVMGAIVVGCSERRAPKPPNLTRE